MKILFVHPPPPNHKDDMALQGIKSSSPSLGLLQLASIARGFGHQVEFLDRKYDYFDSYDYDLVAITAMTNEITQAAKIAENCKAIGIPTVLGGCHVTAEPYKTTVTYPQFTHIIEGEGEWKFTNFIGENSNVFRTMDDFPDPAFDLIDWKKYRLSPFGCKKDRSIGLVTSRGCFGKCTFCSRKVFGNKFRAYSVPRLIQQLERIRKDFQIDDFLFYDDLFTGNRQRLVEFCEKVIGKGFTWSCCSRVDCLDLPTLKLMKRAGCWLIEYGIESGSQEILNRMKKNITTSKIIEALKMTRKSGILSKGNFILGNIGETRKTLQETVSFARNIPLDLMQHTFFAPLPGTESYCEASNEGEFNASWEATNTFAINFVPKSLTRSELKDFSKKLFRGFYLNPMKIFKILRNMSFKQIIMGIRSLIFSL